MSGKVIGGIILLALGAIIYFGLTIEGDPSTEALVRNIGGIVGLVGLALAIWGFMKKKGAAT